MIIDGRFNGPPGSGNGGYAAGVFANGFTTALGNGPVEVTLRLPPPLGVPLTVVDGAVRTSDGSVVAEGRAVDDFDATVPGVSWPTAVAAAADYPGFTEHPFPTCYVCGPERADGLRIFPGRLPDGRTAAPFVAPTRVGPELVWAALDCPGGWAVIAPGRPFVLGRMTTVVAMLPAAGDECVITGMLVEQAGRKAQVHSTLRGPDGTVLAYARATWIAI